MKLPDLDGDWEYYCTTSNPGNNPFLIAGMGTDLKGEFVTYKRKPKEEPKKSLFGGILDEIRADEKKDFSTSLLMMMKLVSERIEAIEKKLEELKR